MKKICMVLGLLGFFILVQGCDKTSTTLDVTNLPVDSVTVHFDANGGSDVDSQVFATSDTNINLPVSEREGYTFIGWYYNLNDLSAGNTLIIITSLGRFLFAGERQVVPGFRPLDNIYPITDLTYVFTLNEGEYIAKLVDTNSYSKSVLTSSGRVLAWGQLYNLGMGTTNDWEMVAPNEINFVYLTSLHVAMYEYGEVITPYVYSKDGYDFVGWYSDDDLSVEFDFLIEVTSDIIIYGYYVLSE